MKCLGKREGSVLGFMDLEKAYDHVIRDALWQVLRLYEVDGRLLRAVRGL